jgi:galactolipid galactosyltransferase
MVRILSFFLLLTSNLTFASGPIHFPERFLFGIANAPGHVEDELDDIWVDFGRAGRIRAYLNQSYPEKRLEFWTKPEVELDLARELGVQVFRLGVDWGRIHPAPEVFDEKALERYGQILNMIKERKMKVMLTLFHFSLPKWVQEMGGWENPQTQKHFVAFAKKVMKELNPQVDYWITFNEPQIFSSMAYAFGIFPPGLTPNPLAMVKVGPFKGDAIKAMDEMIMAHKLIYDWAHSQFKSVRIGIAQHLGYHTGKNALNRTLARFTGKLMNWYFTDRIREHMDYFGFNYYGAEWIKGTGLSIDPTEEYSEAGRAIYPRGLYLLSKKIKKRYGNIPQFITENGVADATDWIRPSYILEHLAAISALQSEGVEIEGYIFWTLTDNLEWSDGYCPKFGLVSVNRNLHLTRHKRESFYLYQQLIQNRGFTQETRQQAWSLLQSHIGSMRPFCRDEDGQTGLDTPKERAVSPRDWRFKIQAD